MGERGRVGSAHERLDQPIELLPVLELAGPHQQVVEDDGGAELARRGEDAPVVLAAGDAQIDPAAPHHGLEVLLQQVRVLVMPADLELREVHVALPAEEVELVQLLGFDGLQRLAPRGLPD